MPIILSAPAKRKNTRRKAPAVRMNGEFYAQPYEQYVQYMYSVGKQPMVAWEWEEKKQAYYAKRTERTAKAAAKAAAKEADKARRAAERAAARASGGKAAKAARAEAIRAGGIPQGLRDALNQTGVPREGITLVVTPEGAVARGSFNTMSGGVIPVLRSHGFIWFPQERAWAFLGSFDAAHFRALGDSLSSWGVEVRRVGFEESPAAAAAREHHAARIAQVEAQRAAQAEAQRLQALAHASVRSAGIPQGLREALAEAGTSEYGVTLVVTPEGAVAKGAYGAMGRGANDMLKAHGFTWLPQEKVWLFLGFFDTAHFRALADDLASRRIKVHRLGFNPRRKAPAKRKNGSRSVVDTVAARELELYIENERNLVGPGNSMGANIMRMLSGRIVRGTYDSTKAWKAWVPLVTEGAKRYKREHGAINASKATRDAVATRLSEAFEAEVRAGAIDPMKLLGARTNRGTLSVAQGNQMPQTRRNPSGREIVPPLAQWQKGDFVYSVRGRKGHGNTEYVIQNFSPTGSAWVALAVTHGHVSVVYTGITGTHFVGTTPEAVAREYSSYKYATPGAARAALVKAVDHSILPHARSSRR